MPLEPQPVWGPWAELEAVVLGVGKEGSQSVESCVTCYLLLFLPCICCGSLGKYLNLSEPGLIM